MKSGTWAAIQDIHVGDVLLEIDGKPTSWNGRSGMIKDGVIDFDSILQMIKSGIHRDSIGDETDSLEGPTLKFRTVEESSRLIRSLAQTATAAKKGSAQSIALEKLLDLNREDLPLKIDIKNIDSSVLVIVSKIDDISIPKSIYSKIGNNADFIVKNHLHSHVVLFKQKGAVNSTWRSLGPCFQQIYVWDNPFLDHKIVIKLDRNIISPYSEVNEASNEVHSSLIDFNLIGSSMPLLDSNGQPSRFIIKIDSEGPSKILRIMLDSAELIERDLQYSNYIVTSQLDALTTFRHELSRVQSEVMSQAPFSMNRRYSHVPALQPQKSLINFKMEEKISELTEFALAKIASLQKDILSSNSQLRDVPSFSEFSTLFREQISQKNQVLVEILQGRGLLATSFKGLLNVFCKVYLKSYDMGSKRFVHLQNIFNYIVIIYER